MAQASVPLAPPVITVISLTLTHNCNYMNQIVAFFIYYILEPIKTIYIIEQSKFMCSLKSIHQLDVGPCDNPFERLMVLRKCSRAIFHPTCMGDIVLLLSSAASLVGNPLGVVCSWDNQVVVVVDLGYPG